MKMEEMLREKLGKEIAQVSVCWISSPRRML